MRKSEDPEFEAFLKRRAEAAEAYVRGDAAPLRRISTERSPATFFGPGGGHLEGAEDVFATYERDAGNFRPGGESRLEILQASAGDEVAYWVGLQHATVNLAGKPEPVPMTLRISEIFRREEGGWKLVHRHADRLAEPTRKP